MGGDPLLFQHSVLVLLTSCGYIMILPGMGVVSELIPCFARKPMFGYRFVAYATIAIGVFGFLVWGHHMFVSSQSVVCRDDFFDPQLSGVCPVGDQGLQLDGHALQRLDNISNADALCFRVIGLFTIGGLTGLFLAALAVDVHLHDTYFVIAHFHYIMVGGAVMGYLGGLHFWWPKNQRTPVLRMARKAGGGHDFCRL